MTGRPTRILEPDTLSHAERTKLLNGIVVPRPIAFVSTLSPGGAANLAPFSYFNVVGDDPMALSFSITAPKADGSEKDTLRNVRPRVEGGMGEFVVNAAAAEYAAKVAACGVALDYGHSEFEHSGLTPAPCSKVAIPRVLEAPAWFECRTLQIVPIGRSNVVIGEILAVGIRPELLDERLRVDIEALDLIARLAGAGYCRIGERFDL